MQLVKSTTHKRTSKLGAIRLAISALVILIINPANAQDNSPYSRYGLGDLHPTTHIFNRGMAGVSQAYGDQWSVNFANPASYSRFYSLQEARTKKLTYGRIILDMGLNIDNRTISEPNNPEKFSSPNAYFSYLQLGIPLRKNWGMVFGLRPISKINYKISRTEKLIDPVSHSPIDTALTQFVGDGGAYLFNTGTGFAIKNFSFGVNAGYLFGKKDYSTLRDLYNDTIVAGYYTGSNYQTKSTFGDLFFSMGMQYHIDLNKEKTKYLQFGLSGNIKQQLNSRNDIIRETYVRSTDGGVLRLDSVSEKLDVKGKVDYPSSIGGGFLMERLPDVKKGGWLIGVDFVQNGWNDYRFNGQIDSVRNNWKLKIGGQIRPSLKDVKYKNLLSYRAGFFFGNDYVYLNKKLPEYGITVGMSLPIANLKDASRRFRNQYSIINIAAEYIKRGNNDNVLSENLFRVSVGFSLTDLWFVKKKYE